MQRYSQKTVYFMIKLLLTILLVISVTLNYLMWIKLDQSIANNHDTSTQVIVENVSVESPIQASENKEVVIVEEVEPVIEKPQLSIEQPQEKNEQKYKHLIEFQLASKQSNWELMLETMQLVYDSIIALDQNSESVDLIVSQLWLEKLTFNKQKSNNDQWIDAMLQYINRRPADLEVGYLYLQYLIEKSEFEDALSYLNYLTQISDDQTKSDELNKKFNDFVLEVLIALEEDNQLTIALNLLNVVLQYEVLNIPFLIHKTQVQILIGDYEGATFTLSQFEYELDYQTPVESLKLQIQNAPKDRSIKLQSYGGQFIVNTLFDDGYQENTIPLLIDTGASISVINEAIFLQYVDTSNVRFIKQINVDTAGGNVPAKLYEIDRIKIGEFEVLNTQFMVLPMALNKPYQGLLGMSFLREFDFNIDQKTSTMHLE